MLTRLASPVPLILLMLLSMGCGDGEGDPGDILTAYPTDTPSSSPTPSRTPSASATPTSATTPTASASPSSPPSPTASPSQAVTPSPTASSTETSTSTPASTPSATTTPSPSPTPTVPPSPTTPLGPTPTPAVDLDGDGSPASLDCDDNNPSVSPDLPELCGNSMDENCDGIPSPCLYPNDDALGQSPTSVLLTGTLQAFEVGTPLLLTPDITGDGIGDLVAANVIFSTSAVVIPGSMEPKERYDLFEDGLTFEGGFGMELGYASATGDVDGDGARELLLGAPGRNVTYLIDSAALGALGRVDLLSPSNGRWTTFNVGAGRSGSSVVSGIDLNGDGCEDIAIGSPDSDSVHLWAGRGAACGSEGFGEEAPSASATLTGSEGFGRSLASLKGEEWTGIAIGAPTAGGGNVAIYLGLGSGALGEGDAALVLRGEGPGDEAGYALGSPGDVDGDGAPELLVGAPYAGEPGAGGTGAVYLVPGAWIDAARAGGPGERSLSEVPWAWFGAEGGMHLGAALGSLGDVDGGGSLDLLIGADRHLEDDSCPPEGGAYVILGEGLLEGEGRLPGAEAMGIGGGEGECLRTGAPLTGGADFNGDGAPDLWIGSKVNQGGDGAFLFLGSP